MRRSTPLLLILPLLLTAACGSGGSPPFTTTPDASAPDAPAPPDAATETPLEGQVAGAPFTVKTALSTKFINDQILFIFDADVDCAHVHSRPPGAREIHIILHGPAGTTNQCPLGSPSEFLWDDPSDPHAGIDSLEPCTLRLLTIPSSPGEGGSIYLEARGGSSGNTYRHDVKGTVRFTLCP
jgi:hypothetical protein